MTEEEIRTESACGCADCEGAPIAETPACECCGRRKDRGEKARNALVNRLKRIEGQVRGIEKMVENSAYCTDIITQVSAAVAALNAVNRELISTHIRTCVATDLRAGKTETAEELALVVERLMK